MASRGSLFILTSFIKKIRNSSKKAIIKASKNKTLKKFFRVLYLKCRTIMPCGTENA